MSIKETDQSEWIALTQWSSKFTTPSYGSLRNIVARRAENGADAFLTMLHGRIYVNIPEFFKWFKNQGVKNVPGK